VSSESSSEEASTGGSSGLVLLVATGIKPMTFLTTAMAETKSRDPLLVGINN
jgi:hypothetical protein